MLKIVRLLIPSILLLALPFAKLQAQEKPFAQFTPEQVRIQRHLEKAEAFMRQNDAMRTILLTPSQKLARETQVKRLAQYRERGVFPRNHHALGALPTPIFRDKDGTLCAMGYLVWESGQHVIVNDVAQGRNLGYLHEIATDARLTEWLAENGLTLEEAARIQPTYCHENNSCDRSIDQGTGFLIAFVTAHSLLSIPVNELIHDRYTRNFRGNWGIASGFLTKAAGIGVLSYGKEGILPGLLLFGIGAQAYKMGQNAFHEGRNPEKPKISSSVTVSPTFERRQGRSNAGIMATFSLSL
jgi:hypothetical protein